ncbi:hypothetical protein PCASD_19163 [Puccinia coronata f. sp. avenae]|uniref:Uncharacterized protein n=1 Tax=Puccinia coronata f. sp. avenae TaxID=200324 RepID=A0A2N5TY88_9BASI|nr:hypothetical protein PCASD_19163 [Puccinia coronata f. sp. avenae]
MAPPHPLDSIGPSTVAPDGMVDKRTDHGGTPAFEFLAAAAKPNSTAPVSSALTFLAALLENPKTRSTTGSVMMDTPTLELIQKMITCELNDRKRDEQINDMIRTLDEMNREFTSWKSRIRALELAANVPLVSPGKQISPRLPLAEPTSDLEAVSVSDAFPFHKERPVTKAADFDPAAPSSLSQLETENEFAKGHLVRVEWLVDNTFTSKKAGSFGTDFHQPTHRRTMQNHRHLPPLRLLSYQQVSPSPTSQAS